MIDKVVSCELSIFEWATLLNALSILEFYDPLEGLELKDTYDCLYAQLQMVKE